MNMIKAIALVMVLLLAMSGAAAEVMVHPHHAHTRQTTTAYLHCDDYTNEEKCFLFLTKEMDLTEAAACGIMANIYKESTFNPAAGSSYYGLVQWGGSRKKNLNAFCAEKGFSASSLEGQLSFLAHELDGAYSSVLEYLESVPNTAQGAYDAAYHFCYYFEIPSNRTAKSNTRGLLAQETYFPEYA